MAESKAERLLKEIQDGIKVAGEGMPETIKAYIQLEQSGGTNHKAFDPKTLELMFLAQAVRSPCKYCIVLHTYNAIKLGATKEEIYEAASVTIPFGGAKTFAYACVYLTDAVETFSK